MNSYPSYKDSGVEWIGEIPSSWSVKRNKYITTPKKDKSEDGSEELLSVSEYLGVVPRSVIREGEDHLTRSESLEGYLKVSKGDLVNNIMLMWKKGLGVSKYDGIVSPSYSVFSFNKSIPTYHHYLFRTDLYITEFRKNSTGIIQSRLRLYDDDFGFIYSYLPPIDEQKQIVSFLDTKTKKIDTLIEKTEQKIKLLKEKRTSLINHCVTKGLNPNVEMKDSGVEWIGEIPKDWNIIPLKFVGDFQNGIGKGSEFFGSGFPFMNYGDVYNNEITPISVDGKVQSDEIERERYSVLRGDVFFTRTSESKDDIGVSSVCLKTLDESVFSGFVIRFRFFDNSHIPEYSRYHFQTHWKKVFIESKMNIVTRSSLSQQVLGQLPVLIPSNEQQKQIIEYLDEQTQKIDSTIEKETQRMDLLKEYRQSLISDVVTGKVDVRDEVLI